MSKKNDEKIEKTEKADIKKDKNKKEKKVKEKKPKLTKAEKKEQKGNFGERFSLKFRRKFIANKAKTWLLVILLVLAFIALNAWARTKATAQIDLTENKLYTLSDTSKEQLEYLDKDVMIYVYGYEDSSAYVTFIKQYVEVCEHVQYEIVTTETNYEVITKYNLDDGTYDTAFVVVCGDRDVTLYPDADFYTYESVNGSYVSVDLTEECITNAILNVATDELIKLYFVSGHGEYVMDTVSGVVSDLEDVIYECEELNLMSATEIPEDCEVLVFLDPTSDISESEAEVVKNYIYNGGDLFVTLYKRDASTDFTNFQSVLDLYGAEVQYGLLYEDSTQNYYNYPYWIIPEISTSSDITSDMATSGYYPVLMNAQAVLENDVDEDSVTVSTEELLYTSTSCYNITDEETLLQGLSIDDLETDSYTVAQKYIRTMGDDEETAVDSNLILIGSAYFMTDQSNAYNSLTADQTFVLNSFADLAEQEDLITIHKYSSDSTTFETTATTFSDLVVKAFIFSIPIIIIIIGIVVWAFRRRKR